MVRVSMHTLSLVLLRITEQPHHFRLLNTNKHV